MREYRRRIAYIVTELLESREAAADADLRDLVTTCILPSIGGDSNVDIEIRNGALHSAPPDLTKRILTGHEQPRRSIEPLRRAFCLATEPTTMRIEIHRWRMVGGPHDDGRVDVAYNVLVPLEDCVPNNSSNIQVLLDRSVYRDYPDATWSTDLAPGWERYEAWLAHECAAKRRMLEFLHQHCPETRALDEWPTLWASIPPELAEDLHTIHFTIPPPGDPNHDHQQHPAPPPADAAA